MCVCVCFVCDDDDICLIFFVKGDGWTKNGTKKAKKSEKRRGPKKERKKERKKEESK